MSRNLTDGTRASTSLSVSSARNCGIEGYVFAGKTIASCAHAVACRDKTQLVVRPARLQFEDYFADRQPPRIPVRRPKVAALTGGKVRSILDESMKYAHDYG